MKQALSDLTHLVVNLPAQTLESAAFIVDQSVSAVRTATNAVTNHPRATTAACFLAVTTAVVAQSQSANPHLNLSPELQEAKNALFEEGRNSMGENFPLCEELGANYVGCQTFGSITPAVAEELLGNLAVKAKDAATGLAGIALVDWLQNIKNDPDLPAKVQPGPCQAFVRSLMEVASKGISYQCAKWNQKSFKLMKKVMRSQPNSMFANYQAEASVTTAGGKQTVQQTTPVRLDL